ncbi:MAG: hypothetical protein Q9162_007879 [Coniocarpon cinnabarinum]
MCIVVCLSGKSIPSDTDLDGTFTYQRQRFRTGPKLFRRKSSTNAYSKTMELSFHLSSGNKDEEQKHKKKKSDKSGEDSSSNDDTESDNDSSSVSSSSTEDSKEDFDALAELKRVKDELDRLPDNKNPPFLECLIMCLSCGLFAFGRPRDNGDKMPTVNLPEDAKDDEEKKDGDEDENKEDGDEDNNDEKGGDDKKGDSDKKDDGGGDSSGGDKSDKSKSDKSKKSKK